MSNDISQQALPQLVSKIERLEEEKTSLQGEIKEVYAEAKSLGYEPKILRKVIQIRRRDDDEIQEEDAMIETYLTALAGGA